MKLHSEKEQNLRKQATQSQGSTVR